MQTKYFLYLALIFVVGCAAYKELEPVPQVSYFEDGYIELKDDDEFFELSEGKKYFIKFPAPTQENIYLVLTMNDKSALATYLTRVFDDGEGQIIKIPDDSRKPENISVYALDRTVPTFFWVIDNVSQDVVLNLQYRYVAAWRYKFETRHAEFETILEKNTQPRDILSAIGVTITAREVDYAGEKQSVQERTRNLKNIQSQLSEIESIFPADILNSDDASYKTYLKLKKDLSNEIAFQQDYLNMLDIMGSVTPATVEMESFVKRAGEYNKFLNQKDRYPEKVLNEARESIAGHITQVVPYYERLLRKKTTVDTININLADMTNLYAACGQTIPAEYRELESYVNTFNPRAAALSDLRAKLGAINATLNKAGAWPDNMFFTEQRANLSRLTYKLPSTDTKSYGKYRSYACTSLLNKEIDAVRNDLSRLNSELMRTEQIVPQINMYKNQGNYSEILRLLKQNSDIQFLMNRYGDIDQLSLTQQKLAIQRAMAAQNWGEADNKIRALHLDQNFLNPGSTLPRKAELVKIYEDSLIINIETVSVSNATVFIEEHKTTLENVDSLYAQKALEPVYIPTFSSKGPAEVQKKKDVVIKRLSYLKYNKFPQTAIETLYRQFTDELHNKGVEKARAIVTHSKYYNGDDKQISNLVAECDPYAAKWLTRAKDYRKIYVLPTSTKIGGSNQYLFKVNIQIPSDAKFPVFDVNIKLPMEIARHAGKTQWYKEITFNKNVLKNEGRFNITSPSADTNYEMQITPLQVNKSGNNVLEIIFEYDAFKVFELSIMAQRPIMKKN